MGGSSSKEDENQANLDQYLQSAEYKQKLNAVYSGQTNQQQALHVPQQLDDDDDYISHDYQGIQTRTKPKIATIQSTTLSAQKNDIYINKSTFKFIQIGESTLQLTFQFSCPDQTQINVWFLGQEKQKTGEIISQYGNSQIQNQMLGFYVQQGQNQEFQNQCKVLLDQKLVKIEQLKHYQMTQDEYSFPLIVKISKINMDHSFTYYCALEKSSTQYIGQCIISKLRVNGQEFLTKDVYGMNESVLGKKNDSEKEPCRICLTNIIDTMIQPCQHVILCQECCQNLRMTGQRCPICRQEIKEFIIIARAN
ncbi:unnamed protein product [Paramecium sonneborni]|uniref:RING-type domain-containing protein n=1 Tax=Paramecium sonneborni TaxID=65129 RepID=A0A8S1R821_9CILI|nr:unnamed protein product [Paramecium sonneborni]